jgi:hypothetical protein
MDTSSSFIPLSIKPRNNLLTSKFTTIDNKKQVATMTIGRTMLRRWTILALSLTFVFLIDGISAFGIEKKSVFHDDARIIGRPTGIPVPVELQAIVPRRLFVEGAMVPRRLLLGGGLVAAVGLVLTAPQRAGAFPFETKERRQLELCLVGLLRLQNWALSVESKIRNAETEDQRKEAYLEARLGSKAIVSGKVGGGSTGRVYILGSLQIRDCLSDLKFYSNSPKKIDQLNQDLIESLASIVEFDGLETTQDPSPRSSLTLSMYTQDKANFVKRMLSERTAPLIGEIVSSFGPDERAQCETYIQQYFSNELPPKAEVKAPIEPP